MSSSSSASAKVDQPDVTDPESEAVGTAPSWHPALRTAAAALILLGAGIAIYCVRSRPVVGRPVRWLRDTDSRAVRCCGQRSR